MDVHASTSEEISVLFAHPYVCGRCQSSFTYDHHLHDRFHFNDDHHHHNYQLVIIIIMIILIIMSIITIIIKINIIMISTALIYLVDC